MSSYGVSINVICQTQDNSGLERDAAKDATINKTLRGNSMVPILHIFWPQ